MAQLVAPLGSRASDSYGENAEAMEQEGSNAVLAISSSATSTAAPTADQPSFLAIPTIQGTTPPTI